MSQRPAYNYGSTARKLDRTLEAPRHGIEVMPGGARQERAASSGAILFAKLLIAFIVAFAAIGCVRITLSSATVATAMEARQIDSRSAMPVRWVTSWRWPRRLWRTLLG